MVGGKVNEDISSIYARVLEPLLKSQKELVKIVLEIQKEDEKKYKKLRALITDSPSYFEFLKALPSDITAQILRIQSLLSEASAKMSNLFYLDLEEKEELLDLLNRTDKEIKKLESLLKKKKRGKNAKK